MQTKRGAEQYEQLLRQSLLEPSEVQAKRYKTRKRPSEISPGDIEAARTYDGAGYRARTDDIQLGKLTLYQLS